MDRRLVIASNRLDDITLVIVPKNHDSDSTRSLRVWRRGNYAMPPKAPKEWQIAPEASLAAFGERRRHAEYLRVFSD